MHTKYSVKTLADNVARLSRLLTRARDVLPPAYLKDAGLREAYVAYFLPPNMQKIMTPLQELALHPAGLLLKEKLRILDIGCGPGTAVLGVMEFFSRQDQAPELEFLAVDHVAENLQITNELFASCRDRLNMNAALNTIRSGIEGVERVSSERFDIIIFSNVLNELFAQDEDKIKKRVAVLNHTLRKLLAEQGSCIIVEPALRETSREMLEVRDALLKQGLQIYSPCLMSRTCPALEYPKDWCHEDVPWTPPDRIKEIDKLTGLRKDSLKFSYLVLRKDALSLSDVYDRDAFRVVSEPLVSKGKIEYYICGGEARRLITRLDKDRTDANQAFDDLQRGNVVVFDGLIDEEKRFKVAKETVVRKLF